MDGRADGDPNASNYLYSWTPTTGLSDPNVAQPLASPALTTTYSLTVNSNFGCGSDVVDMTVTIKPTPEVLALNVDTILCEGDEIVLSATHSWTTAPSGPVVYTWSPLESILGSPFEPVVTVRPTETTIYEVKVSVASDDCPTTDQVFITVSPEVIAEITADTTRICEGDQAQLTATGGLGNATFTWSPAAGLDNALTATPLAGPDSTRIYEVIISEGACADTAQISIDVNPAPEAAYFSSLPNGCAPLMVSFMENAGEATAFEWSFGDGSAVVNGPNPNHMFELPGEYLVTLKAIGMGGCEDLVSSTMVTVSDDLSADFTSTPFAGEVELALPGAKVDFTDMSINAVKWYWEFGDGTVSDEQKPQSSLFRSRKLHSQTHCNRSKRLCCYD